MRIRKGRHVAKRLIINFGFSPLDTSTSVPTFGEKGLMPTKGKGEPSCKSIEGSPTLAGVRCAEVSTTILWLRAGSRLVTPSYERLLRASLGLGRIRTDQEKKGKCHSSRPKTVQSQSKMETFKISDFYYNICNFRIHLWYHILALIPLDGTYEREKNKLGSLGALPRVEVGNLSLLMH